MPLSLRRTRGQSILIGNDIRITVTKCKNTHVVLKCEAPPNVKIMREELYNSIKKQLIKESEVEVDVVVTDGGKQPPITIFPKLNTTH